MREIFEEIGIKLKETEVELIFQFQNPDDWGSLIDVYWVRRDISLVQIKIQKEELSEVKWVSRLELQNMVNHNEMSEMVLFALPAVCARSGC